MGVTIVNEKLGIKLKSAGMATVLEKEKEAWRERYRQLAEMYLLNLDLNQQFSAEHIRLFARKHGLPNPRSGKSWGAMFNACLKPWIKQNRVGLSGDLYVSRIFTSNARKQPLYVRWID